jgi:hypothetical protein
MRGEEAGVNGILWVRGCFATPLHGVIYIRSPRQEEP